MSVSCGYSRVGYHDDINALEESMVMKLKEIGKEFVDETIVKTSYGVPNVVVSKKKNRKTSYGAVVVDIDPRIDKTLRTNREYCQEMAFRDKSLRQISVKKLKDGVSPAIKKMSDDLKARSNTDLEEVHLNYYREQLEKPPFDERPYNVPPSVICQRLRKSDIEAATLGLAFYNNKFPNKPYYLEEVYGTSETSTCVCDWVHCNFRASARDGSPSKLFFLELHHSYVPTLCCILDGIPNKRGCKFCSNDFVHPEKGGFLHGLDLKHQKTEVCEEEEEEEEEEGGFDPI